LYPLHFGGNPVHVGVRPETLGPTNESATSSPYDLGRRISLMNGEDRQSQFLFQRTSVAIKRFNALLLHDGFSLSSDDPH